MDSGGAEEWRMSGLRIRPKKLQQDTSTANRADSDD